MSDDAGVPRFKPAAPRQALPRRFYKAVTVAAIVPSPLVGEGKGGGDSRTFAVGIPPTPNPFPRGGGELNPTAFRILLDGKPIRTPAKGVLALPTQALAQAVAAEWEAQHTHIDPETMPLTRIANSAIDGVAPRRAAVVAEIVQYGASDLLCYRAEAPEALVRRQAELWDPILAWSRASLGAELRVANGIIPVSQPKAARAALARALAPFDPFGLAALHIITTLTGSALLALAHGRGQIDADAAWTAAHVDEDFQIGRWGEDAEAQARCARRSAEMRAASRMLALLGER